MIAGRMRCAAGIPCRLTAATVPLSGGAAAGVDRGALALYFLALSDFGDPLRVRDLEWPGRCGVVEIGNGHDRQAPSDRPLDSLQIVLFFRREERERGAHGICAAC